MAVLGHPTASGEHVAKAYRRLTSTEDMAARNKI